MATAAAELKVLLVGDHPPPYGGISVHVQQLLSFLRQEGIQARVLDIGKGGRPAPDVLPVRTAMKLATEVSRHASEGYVIHLHTNGGNPKSWGVVAAVGALTRPWGGRMMVTLHSGLLPAYLASSVGARASTRAALLLPAETVAVSPAIRDALLAIGVPPRQISVHPAFLASAVRAGEAPEGFAAARKRRQPLLAFANHPSPVYGRALLWKALQRAEAAHPRIGVAVFGPGSDTDDFRAEARAAGVEHLVESFGELPHPLTLGLISRCDVFVRPTLADGDAISVREALALGVPCLASDAALRPEGTVTFRSNDAEDLQRMLGQTLAAVPAVLPGLDAGTWLLPRYWALAAPPSSGAFFHAPTPPSSKEERP